MIRYGTPPCGRCGQEKDDIRSRPLNSVEFEFIVCCYQCYTELWQLQNEWYAEFGKKSPYQPDPPTDQPGREEMVL
jgi:hypothetical protein